ncbi:Recombinase family protein, XerD-like [Desulfonema limicola]|uniref:Recombinase family protein, XerD-like n=1 Tax=Desulfonema limicola TaxID=45656 RepID=A0A975B827_9BACT|nr:tyrosine-type recombinase/integrase [Desulfonema limicola]QTA80553.1 Recombinase family protein, XerD-like [Desulfonema limicola]
MDKPGKKYTDSAMQEFLDLISQYLLYIKRTRPPGIERQKRILKVLNDLVLSLVKLGIAADAVRIPDIDLYLKKTCQGLSSGTTRDNRSIIRAFLRYLYHEHRLYEKDLSVQLISAPVFNQDNPPRFLRTEEVSRLFAAASLSTPKDLRTNAILHLAFSSGLRPVETAKITLDDIAFKQGELSVPSRKGVNPAVFPLSEDTVKAVTAYIIGARPESRARELFLGLYPPYEPVTVYVIRSSISQLMRKAGVLGTPYSLRHTYAQNLLESGASIYEIKEMLGHDSLKSTKKYLHVDIKLMRKVLFNDTI